MTTRAQVASWDRIQTSLTDRQAEVFQIIHGSPEGATLREIADKLELEMNQVSGRVRELQQLSLVRDSGRGRLNPRSGIEITVWVSVPKGQLELSA